MCTFYSMDTYTHKHTHTHTYIYIYSYIHIFSCYDQYSNCMNLGQKDVTHYQSKIYFKIFSAICHYCNFKIKILLLIYKITADMR